MNEGTFEHAERRLMQRMQQHLDRQHAATVLAVTFGVAAGVTVATAIAMVMLNRAQRSALVTDDPEAPLFV